MPHPIIAGARPEARTAPADSNPPCTAVILAAGSDDATQGDATPMPLVELLGLALVERCILTLARAGVTRFRVAVGLRADEVSRGIRGKRRLRGLSIEFVHCESYHRGSGHSLAAASAGLEEPFFLAMADHVFDYRVAAALRDRGCRSPELVHLATDGDPARGSDREPTTVLTDGDRVIAIGKSLARSDRVAAGVCCCPAWLPGFAAAATAEGADSVAAIMACAAAEGKLSSCPIEPLPWHDVATPGELPAARRRLLEATRKPTDGPISRWFNRRLSLAVTAHLASWGITPNAATAFVLLLGLSAAALICVGRWPHLAAAGVLVQLASVLDGCDGELARVTLQSSRFGAWFDTGADNVRYIAMVAASAVALHGRYRQPAFLLLGVLFVLLAVGFIVMMNRHLVRTHAPGTHLVILDRIKDRQEELARRRWHRFVLRLRPFIKNDVSALYCAVALVAGLPELVLAGGLFAVIAGSSLVARTLRTDPETPRA